MKLTSLIVIVLASVFVLYVCLDSLYGRITRHFGNMKRSLGFYHSAWDQVSLQTSGKIMAPDPKERKLPRFTSSRFAPAFLLKYFADRSDLIYFDSRFRQKTGASIDIPNGYQLMSLDGGETWYAVTREGNNVTLLGLAGEVYPGLLERLAGWEKLTAYVDKNGPLRLRGESLKAEISLLEGAGFQVKETK